MYRFCLCLTAALLLGAPARGAIVMSVTDEVTEERRGTDLVLQFQPIANYLRHVLDMEVTLVFSQNLTHELQRTRSGIYDVLFGPAHVIGSALRYGYEPLVTFAGDERMVFVVSPQSSIKSLPEAQGMRLGLPAHDSLATYLAYGEFNARGWQPRKYFGEVHNFRFHDVVLHAVEFGMIDIGVVRERVAKTWLAKTGGRVVFETRPVPSLGVAVNSALGKSLQARVRDALLGLKLQHPAIAPIAQPNDLGELLPMTKERYAYISTLGYFTPTVLPGVKIVTGEQVVDLLQNGASLFDVRTEREYRDKHCKGARLLTYLENSRKEVGFDMSQDEFRLADAARDKSAPIIFACNGAECWKSYKAAAWAQKHGYTDVHWFRGGFPECRAKGLVNE